PEQYVNQNQASSPQPAIQKSFQLPAANRMLEFTNGLGLDLTDSFTGHFENAANFFERVIVTVAEAVAQFDDLALAVRQRLQDLLNLVFEHFLGRCVDRGFAGVILDEVAEITVLALADRAVQTNGMPTDLKHPTSFFDRNPGRPGGFFNRRFAA